LEKRILTFAKNSVALTWAGEPSGEVIRLLFGSHPGAPSADVVPRATFSLASVPRSSEITLSLDTSPQSARGAPGQIAARLLDLATSYLTDRSRGGLLFHAACLSREGKAWLLAGPAGSGKSSLALWLALHAGFRCLSDELTFLPSGTASAQGFFRAIYLKGTAVDLFDADYAEEWQTVDASADLAGGVLVPPDFAGEPAAADAEAPGIQGIFLTTYREGSTYTFTPLSKAEAAIELAKVLVNSRNLPERGFPELVRLARVIPVYRMDYSSFDQIPASVWEK
jgi:hypothetical protein